MTRIQQSVKKLIMLTRSHRLVWTQEVTGYHVSYAEWELLLDTDGAKLEIKLIGEKATNWYVPLLEGDALLKELVDIVQPLTFQIEAFIEEILQEKE